MEVKINREIRDYTESMFFGLSFRQFFFSFIGCLSAVVIYFMFKEKIGLETTSWLCMIVAAPFIAMGFLTYNGMTAEKVLYAWIKTELLIPKHLIFKPTNFYYELLKDNVEKGGY